MLRQIEVTKTSEIPQLDAMTRDELLAFAKTICGARWGEIALLTEDEAYNAVCLKMLHGGLTQADIVKAMPALNGWADRMKGKPAQSVAIKGDVRHEIVFSMVTEPKVIEHGE